MTALGGTGYVVGVSSSVAISITDNETTTISVSATHPNAGEPSNNGTFRVTRSGDTTSQFVVDFTMGGTANRCTDFLPESPRHGLQLKTADGSGGSNSVTFATGPSYRGHYLGGHRRLHTGVNRNRNLTPIRTARARETARRLRSRMTIAQGRWSLHRMQRHTRPDNRHSRLIRRHNQQQPVIRVGTAIVLQLEFHDV